MRRVHCQAVGVVTAGHADTAGDAQRRGVEYRDLVAGLDVDQDLTGAVRATRVGGDVASLAPDVDRTEKPAGRIDDDAGPYTFVAADALVLKVREEDRVVAVHALVATGVNADGHREVAWIFVESLPTAWGQLRVARRSWKGCPVRADRPGRGDDW